MTALRHTANTSTELRRKGCQESAHPHYFCVIWSNFSQIGPKLERRRKMGSGVRDLFCGAEELRARNKFGSELAGFSAVSHRSASLRRASESRVILISIQVAVSQ